MQTFLPYPSFYDSARCLDRMRLGKQRVESLQILRTLTGQTSGWRNHPAVKMWRGYEPSLTLYGVLVCDEWLRRGHEDTCRAKIVAECPVDFSNTIITKHPPWLGNKEFHASHQSALLRKDPLWYGQYHWTVPNNLPYVWPVK